MNRTHLGGAVLVAVGVLALVGLWGCNPAAQTPTHTTMTKPVRRLVVLTPHNPEIQYAFTAGFVRWAQEHLDEKVHIEWIYRGTPQCVDYVRRVSARDARDAGDFPDLMFGGGLAAHGTLRDERLSRPVDVGDAMENVPAEVNGYPTRDAEGYWFATGLSSFGIFYHREACEARGIAPPKTWSDLADPRFFEWVALADPRASGSHRECLTFILQSQGWDQGWQTIHRILGNVRALSARSGDALRLVQSGYALATFAVNFDALPRVVDSDGKLAYIDPEGATAATPDIISALKAGPASELADHFINYVLSEEGQLLWSVKAEDRMTPGATLYHYPLRPGLYDTHAEQLSVSLNPFKKDFGLKVDVDQARKQSLILKPLVAAACGKNHIPMQQIWEQIIADGSPPALVEVLSTAPMDEATALAAQPDFDDPDSYEYEEKMAQWVGLFEAQYGKVREMLKSPVR
jgi:ABC-type Fe3+ transport system substrate-binding protein